MWAPADIFTPVVNAIALALKRTATLVSEHLLVLVIAFVVLVAIAVAIGQIRRKPRA